MHDVMTTNDTKALLAALREIKEQMKDNTAMLKALVKIYERDHPPFIWPPSPAENESDAEQSDPS